MSCSGDLGQNYMLSLHQAEGAQELLCAALWLAVLYDHAGLYLDDARTAAPMAVEQVRSIGPRFLELFSLDARRFVCSGAVDDGKSWRVSHWAIIAQPSRKRQRLAF